MRLVTFNVCSGRAGQTGPATAVDPAALASAVAELAPDILMMQEVDVGQERSGGHDQGAEAAEAMGCRPADWRFAPALHGTPGQHWTPAYGELATPGSGSDGLAKYGIALLSRLPVLEWTLVRLAAAPLRSPVVVPGSGGRPAVLLLRDEPRVALAAVLRTAAGPMTVVTTHLSFVPGWNVRQLRQVRRQTEHLPRPLILAGDLNLPGRVPSLITGWRPLAAERTFPASSPRVQLDHVLLADDPFAADGRVAFAGARQMGISDHRALVVDLSDQDAQGHDFRLP